METHQIQSLLDQVNAITARYKKINELTGENFNVFRILKLESSEVRMHSAFLAELLKPNGSHGQKDIFLKLFVKAFCFKENLIDTQSCKIKIEESIGAITDDGTVGGRIDIVIVDKHHHKIIIENKIHAGDQNNQLTRYYNSANNADIIYLTLDGKLPSGSSRGELEDGIHYKCYSYKHDILNWLDLCRKEVAIYPIVREALTHYINLIKFLTNQTLNKNMQDELSDLLKINMEASFAIADNLDIACDKLLKSFGSIIESECEKIQLNCIYRISFDKNYSGIWIYRSEWKYANIAFQFQNWDKDLIYGIAAKKNPKDFPIPTEVRDKIKALPNNSLRSNIWWPWFKKFDDPYNDWSKFNAWNAISDNRMKDIIMERVGDLLAMTKDCEM